MPGYVALWDARLQGGIPTRPNLTIVNTDGNTPLSSAFAQISGAARSNGGKIKTMFVLCHGYAGENTRAAVCMDAGGMGLQLGKENVLHANVAMWNAIKDTVTNVVVYACAASDTQAGNEGTTADGRYLMGAMAIYTNAMVYAADKIQWYNVNNGAFDFGAWEGKLWQFPPTGAPPAIVPFPPVEIGDVFNGTAP